MLVRVNQDTAIWLVVILQPQVVPRIHTLYHMLGMAILVVLHRPAQQVVHTMVHARHQRTHIPRQAIRLQAGHALVVVKRAMVMLFPQVAA